VPGYFLLERTMLAPAKPDGLEPFPEELGFLDFLREVAADPFPLPRYAEIRVVGLEEVLFAARPDGVALAAEIHRRLRRASADLERQLLSVQVLFRASLIRGDSLWAEFRSQRVPVGHIFGSPPPHTDSRGNRFFPVNFNLTHV
jgi:hypothetical protein